MVSVRERVKTSLLAIFIASLLAALGFLIILVDDEEFFFSDNALVASRDAVIPDAYGIACESPGLRRGDFHVIVAGYHLNNSVFPYSTSPSENYLLDVGLTNADVFWYRRDSPEKAISSLAAEGPCGVRMHERLLLPRVYGDDLGPFLDYVIEMYSRLPRAVAYLHDHGATPDATMKHTNCEAVFARVAFFYRDLARPATPNLPRIKDHMTTLTSWNGRASQMAFDDETPGDNERTQRGCKWFLDKWEKSISANAPYGSDVGRRHPNYSCCSSFILPAERIRRFPLEFYKDWKNILMRKQEDMSITLRGCFEYLVYDFLGDQVGQFSKEQLMKFYGDADALVNTERDDPTLDKSLLKRLQRCKAKEN